MKVVFVSNYFNHHQKPFCEEMYRRLGDDFTFISTAVMGEERKKLGYTQYEMPKYVWLGFGGVLQKEIASILINTADIVIAGSAPQELLESRIKEGKLVIRYAERPFKKKPPFYKRMGHAYLYRKRDAWKRSVYMLCASAYAAKDFASVGMYRNRMYKWGYFPNLKEYDIDELLSRKKRNTLMWCGRFIDWKHPDDAIKLAQKLKAHGYDFELNLVGAGVMEQELHLLAESAGLLDCVHFLGSMPPEQVRAHMEEAGIYLFTSDRQEGWGAVLNESMNSGCAVVASHALGSAPFLIRDGENGLIYSSGNVDALFEKVRYLLDQPDKQAVIGRAAYQTMVSTWNANIAAERILQLSESLLAGNKSPILFDDGPVSKAKP